LRPRSHYRDRRGRVRDQPLIGAAPYAAVHGVGLRHWSNPAPEGDLEWRSPCWSGSCCSTSAATSPAGLDAFSFSSLPASPLKGVPDKCEPRQLMLAGLVAFLGLIDRARLRIRLLPIAFSNRIVLSDFMRSCERPL